MRDLLEIAVEGNETEVGGQPSTLNTRLDSSIVGRLKLATKSLRQEFPV